MKPQAQESLWQARGSRKECIHPGACCVSTYRGHIRVRRGHLHQVDVVGGILPGRVVVIDVQEGDIHLWATRSVVLWSAEVNEGKGRVLALKGLSSNSSAILGVSRRA